MDQLKENSAATDAFLIRILQTEHLSCPVCGYDLHQATAARCPECGKPMVLALRPEIGLRRTWTAALVLSSLIAGLGVFFLFLFIKGYGHSGRKYEFLPEGIFWQFIFVCTLADIPLAPLLFYGRRFFQQRSRLLQILFIIALMALAVIAGRGFYRTI